MDMNKMISAILTEPRLSRLPAFTRGSTDLDEIWRTRYFRKTYDKVLNKMFEGLDGETEQLTLESLLIYMRKCPRQLWFSQHFVMCLKDFLVEKLNESDCKDPALVAAAINFNCAYKNRSMNAVRWHVENELMKSKPGVKLLSVLDGVDFKKMSIERVLGDRSLHLLKLLIRYGAIPPQTSDAYNPVTEEMLLDFMKGVRIPSRGLLSHISIEVNLVGLSMKMRYLNNRHSSPEEYNARISRRHIVATVIGTLNIDAWDPQGETVGVKCLKYYFEAIPEPFVITREMEELIFEPNDLTDVLDVSLVKAKLDRYAILFPDWDVLQPRSLKHLSRCAARSYLCRQGMLPDVISKLTVPNVLKDYLLIKNVVD